jgi:hypothetical protein
MPKPVILYSGTHIRWACHSYRWGSQVIFTIMNMSLLNGLYQLWNTCQSIAFLHKLLWHPACVHVMKWPVLRRVAYPSGPMIHHRCVLCHESLSVGIYCHPLNGNQLVQLKGCLWSFLPINVQANLQHVNLKWNDLKYPTHMKHMYCSILLLIVDLNNQH